MKKLKVRILSITLLILLLGIGNAASADCDPNDGNNSAATAAPFSLTQPVTGTVCPDDPFDFYTFTVQQGEDYSGTVTFSSPQASTVLRLYKKQTNEKIIDDLSTTDTTKQHVVTIGSGELTPGMYFIRVFFWSSAAFDHDYTITANLSLEGTGKSYELTRAPELQVTMSPAAISKSPWSSKHASAFNTSRSRFAGPTGNFIRTDFWKLKPSVDDEYPEEWYRDLRVGPNNQLFYTYGTDAKVGSSSWIVELPKDNLTIGVTTPPALTASSVPNLSGEAGMCLDYSGRLYVIKYQGGGLDYKASLICFDNSLLKELWRKELATSISERKLLGAGEYIYTYHETPVGSETVSVWDKDGELIRDLVVTEVALALAEDALHQIVYVQSADSLFKFNNEGDVEWKAGVSDQSHWDATTEIKFGPIVSYDGRIWVNKAYSEDWIVFNSDGSHYKEGNASDYPDELLPGYRAPGDKRIATALSTDGKLVTVTRNSWFGTVACFSDWDHQLWVKNFDMVIVHDMVMDSQNRIYMCISDHDMPKKRFFHYILVLDATDGSVEYKLPVEGFTGGEVSNTVTHAELAIGENNQLIMLQQAGWMASFGASDVKVSESSIPSIIAK